MSGSSKQDPATPWQGPASSPAATAASAAAPVAGEPEDTSPKGAVPTEAVPSPRAPKPFFLFVYGTLMVSTVFRAVLGRRLARHKAETDGSDAVLARDAVLAGYKKISPDSTYLYAVPDPNGRIRGYVVGPLSGESLSHLRRYEGKNYRQKRLWVETAEGRVKAVAFVANLDKLSHSFGYQYGDPYKQEVLLRRKIDAALREDEIARLHTDDVLTRRALRELHGKTIRDLMRGHFDSGGISTFAIRQAIQEEPLRELPEMSSPESHRLAMHYLAMMVRQVMFNQIEDRIFDEFRYDIDQMHINQRYYSRTISALAALRLLNRYRTLLDLLAGDALADLPPTRGKLIDYVRWAILAADQVYQAAEARAELELIRNHMGQGGIPLGCELEFSNIGNQVVAEPPAPAGRDGQYDGFLYFRDFALDILTWKLGGHVDDHHVKSSTKRRRGFFELAFGSLSVEANLSQPITDDPWLLNQIIHAATEFYDVRAHSLHISLQLRSPNRPETNRPLPLGVLQCLFALAGDAAKGPDGVVRILRLANQEIVRAEAAKQILFTSTSRRRSADLESPGGRGHWVQQFKFLRLSKDINYEPIIVALKGVQIHYKPGNFLTAQQYRTLPALCELGDELLAWADRATPIGRGDVEEFLSGVEQGLLTEHRGQSVHSRAYIRFCLSQLHGKLRQFNEMTTVAGKSSGVAPLP